MYLLQTSSRLGRRVYGLCREEAKGKDRKENKVLIENMTWSPKGYVIESPRTIGRPRDVELTFELAVMVAIDETKRERENFIVE